MFWKKKKIPEWNKRFKIVEFITGGGEKSYVVKGRASGEAIQEYKTLEEAKNKALELYNLSIVSVSEVDFTVDDKNEGRKRPQHYVI